MAFYKWEQDYVISLPKIRQGLSRTCSKLLIRALQVLWALSAHLWLPHVLRPSCLLNVRISPFNTEYSKIFFCQ